MALSYNSKYNLEVGLSRNHPEYMKVWMRKYRSKFGDVEKRGQDNYRKNNTLKYLYSMVKRRAKRKGIEFTISLDDLGTMPEKCPLLNIVLSPWIRSYKYNPSIDRIDSSKGYIPGNVWIISRRANMLKNNATAAELLFLATNLMKIEDK